MGSKEEKSLLTQQHKGKLKKLARSKDRIYLFESPSLSGTSLTLRYRRDWVDSYRGYQTPRYMTSMVFSVNIFTGEYKNSNDGNPQQIEKYSKMVEEAKTLFNETRGKVQEENKKGG